MAPKRAQPVSADAFSRLPCASSVSTALTALSKAIFGTYWPAQVSHFA